MKKLIVYLIIVILYQNNLFSQFDFDFNTQSGLTNFNMNNLTPVNTAMGINNFDLNYSADNNMSYFGGLGLIQYYNFSERNYISGYFGTGYSSYMNDAEDASINIYANSVVRRSLNIDDLSDSYRLSSGVQYIKQISETGLIYLGTDFKYKSFNLANDLNFVENVVNFTFNQSFETKTSMKLSANLNNKLYKNIPEIIDTDPMQNSKSDQSLNSLTSQLNYEIGLAQNVFESTGIRASLSGTFLLSNYNTPLDYIGFDFAGDSEFFDDPYSFEHYTLKFGLTQYLPLEIKLSLSASFSNKNYNYDVLIDETKYAQRKDNQSNYELSLEKIISFESGLLTDIQIKFDYEYYSNQSNYDFMNFNGNYFMVGVALGF
jgi:hypothetical protein